ncbi:MAG: hypothetical protein C0483_00810 [Pirellula sp.]|nr:hypothetical protein [Pirellula sp.]
MYGIIDPDHAAPLPAGFYPCPEKFSTDGGNERCRSVNDMVVLFPFTLPDRRTRPPPCTLLASATAQRDNSQCRADTAAVGRMSISTSRNALVRLLPIDPRPSPAVGEACEQLDVAAQTVQAALDLYARRGFIPPWICYLAEQEGRIVGSCGFAAPPSHGEAEIAYFTFPGNEGQGIARAMAVALMREARQTGAAETFIAHTLPEEGPSTSILKRLGFECLGVIEHPEDGAIWKWRERRIEPTEGS